MLQPSNIPSHGRPCQKGNNINLIILFSEHAATLGIDFTFFLSKCRTYYGTKFNEPVLLFFKLRNDRFFIKQTYKELY